MTRPLCVAILAATAWMSIWLGGCDDSHAIAALAGTRQGDRLADRTSDGAQHLAQAERNMRAVPGSQLRGGMLDGESAAAFGLGVALSAAVTDDGTLRADHLDSALTIEFLEHAIEAYSSLDVPADPAARLVFYCNAYNANALSILSMLAMQGNAAGDGAAEALTDTQQFGAQPVLIAGETLTMQELREERILALGDPRVLAYLIHTDGDRVRCPRSPLSTAAVDAQLDALCRAWVRDGAAGMIVRGEAQPGSLLARYASAFEGSAFGDVATFLKRYATPASPVAMEAISAETSG